VTPTAMSYASVPRGCVTDDPYTMAARLEEPEHESVQSISSEDEAMVEKGPASVLVPSSPGEKVSASPETAPSVPMEADEGPAEESKGSGKGGVWDKVILPEGYLWMNDCKWGMDPGQTSGY